MQNYLTNYNLPDNKGHFEEYGGKFVPETLIPALHELEKIFSKYEVLQKEKVIAYCGGGIAATNIAFVLTALGYKNISVYDASLSEWAKINNLPMSID